MRPHVILAPAIAAVLLAVGCSAPHRLTTRTTTITSFGATTRCGQGPYDISIPATGHRWGEAVELRVSAPRRVKFTATIHSDAQGRRALGQRLLGGTGTRPDNRRCVVSLDEVSAPDTAGVPDGGGTAGGGHAAPPSSAGGTPGGVSGGSGTPPTASLPALVSVDSRGGGEVLVHASWSNPTLEPPALRAGGRIRVRLWSVVPNDLEGVTFSLHHQHFVPNKGGAAFEAHLIGARDKRRRARLRRHAQLRRKAQVTTRPPRVVSDADRRKWRADAQRRHRDRIRGREKATARLQAKRRRAALRVEYCDNHLQDRGCWGPGGFRIHVALNGRADERRTYCRTAPHDARCWTHVQRFRRQQRWKQRRLVVTTKPSGPPPAPLTETPAPRPSVNAQWRPGYWHWSVEWKWIGGQWRVPDTDVNAGLTATAPRPPPPAPVAETRPPPPARAAVWVAGYWHWTGAEFTWVVGSWQLRPAPGLRWRATRWKIRVGGAVLLPGKWIR